MKKILTVSLFAVMAVSAAHAKIASTDYVDDQVSPVATKVGDANFTAAKIATNAGNVTAAVTALDTKLSEVASGSGLTLGENAVDTANIVNGAVTLDKVNKDVKDSIADAKAAGTTAASDLAAHITTASNTFETKQDATAKLTEAKNYTDSAVAAEKSRAEGVEQGLQTAINAINNETTGVLAQAKEYTSGKIGDLGESANVVAYVDAVRDTVTGANEIIDQLNNSLTEEVNRAKAAEQANATTAAAALKAAQDEATRAEGEESRIEGLVTAEAARADAAEKANAQAIADMKDATKEGSLAKQVAAKQDKSNADYAVGTTGGTWTTLGTLSADCATEGVRCALVSDGGVIKWEVVQD